jgi:FtsH-binding integral membrane protein
MDIHDAPQLPLTTAGKVRLACGIALFLAQLLAAIVVAPMITGPGDADAGWLAAFWLASVPVAVVTVLLVVRQANLPDIATASMLVAISVYATFALSGALDARGDGDRSNLTDALFLGITGGGLTGVLVWGVALAMARLLKLPTTELAAKREE